LLALLPRAKRRPAWLTWLLALLAGLSLLTLLGKLLHHVLRTVTQRLQGL
jgi:hypothetical protein